MEKAIYKVIGKNIQIRRKRLGWSQTELARTLGVAPQQVQKYESGKNAVMPEKLKILSEIFRCMVDDMFYDPETLPLSSEVFKPSHMETEQLKQIMRDFLSSDSSALHQQICAVVHTMVTTAKQRRKVQ